MTMPPSAEELQEQIEAHLSREAREWLSDLLHDHVGRVLTNVGLQAEIVLKAWDRNQEMAHSEMQDLRQKLSEASTFIVALVRQVTPPPESE